MSNINCTLRTKREVLRKAKLSCHRESKMEKKSINIKLTVKGKKELGVVRFLLTAVTKTAVSPNCNQITINIQPLPLSSLLGGNIYSLNTKNVNL